MAIMIERGFVFPDTIGEKKIAGTPQFEVLTAEKMSDFFFAFLKNLDEIVRFIFLELQFD